MLPEVYISVFAGYMYDIGTHAAKRRNQANRTLSGQSYSISKARQKIYCSSNYRRRIGQKTIITRLQKRNKEMNKKGGRLDPA